MTNAAPRRSLAAAGRGQVAVLTMIGVALLAAAFAWWWTYYSGRRAMEFFGSEAATLIRTAPLVEFRSADGDAYIDISTAPGLLNARTSLLADASYEWNIPSQPVETSQFTVRFSDDGRAATLAFDFPRRQIAVPATGRTATLIPRTAAGWQAYLERQARAARPPTTPPEPARTAPSE